MMDLGQFVEPAAITGAGMAATGAAWWFKRWTQNVDRSLAGIAEILRHLSEKTAVAESQLKDIDRLRERSIINEQRILAAHRRLDEHSNH